MIRIIGPLLVTVAMLAALEGALRLVGWPPPSRDPTLLGVLPMFQPTNGPDGVPMMQRHDQKTVSFRAEKPANGFRVFVIGDLERILVMDWDVHHGNGTQHSFYADPGVLYVSTHRYPFYPGTGAIDEIGVGDGEGFTVNMPFPGGFGDAEYAEAFRTVIEPIAAQYAPQFVLVSAGFDPHRRDPLGGMAVSEQGFADMARSLLAVADQISGGRCVALLEGGYDLQAIRDSASVVLDELRAASRPPLPAPVSSSARPILDAVRKRHAPFWKF